MRKTEYKTMVVLNDERKKKFEYICKEENRNKTNMIATLIDNHYRRIQKKKMKENSIIENSNYSEKNFKETIELNFKKKEIGDYQKPPHEVYERLLKLEGSVWEGNLEESRS